MSDESELLQKSAEISRICVICVPLKNSLLTTHRSLLNESSVLQQRISARLFATEIDIHGHFAIDAAGGEDKVAEFGSHLGVEDVASLLERVEGVGIEHL